ncbi:uncharacterized protein FOMMEDRAFT_153171 [Fomitiporia mediterranea MF3/22]|uniref:uncharacterized protein n=1 Tax=Fomitiporia mediterranea (strain MF3/22) TaxID=694068 RepID=UPI0004409C01|nr:uncharacterized protein FOMMEDRAFT_153171 [Fomitiporia mediterranea MF3/22]EJD05828.1 hypothetical protein FOMMEDRAFT_153171 [Fomitiporia mediterranea MF3/22]
MYSTLRLIPQARILSTSSASFRSDSLRHAAAGSQARSNFWNTSGFKSATALAGISLGLTSFLVQRQPVSCDAPPPKPSARASPSPDSMPKDLPPLSPPPHSSFNTFELGFGTVAGICTGVFVKKGAKLLAFTLGGVFVLLQYLVNLRLVRVNWSRAESRFQDMFYSRERVVGGEVVKRPPTLLSLWRWLVDFLTADFPPRATFIAGMALGLRIG